MASDPTSNELSALDLFADATFRLDIFLTNRRDLRRICRLWSCAKEYQFELDKLEQNQPKQPDVENIGAKLRKLFRNSKSTTTINKGNTARLSQLKNAYIDAIKDAAPILNQCSDPTDDFFAGFGIVNDPGITDNPKSSFKKIENIIDRLWNSIGGAAQDLNWPKLGNDRYALTLARIMRPAENKLRNHVACLGSQIDHTASYGVIDRGFINRLYSTCVRLGLRDFSKKVEIIAAGSIDQNAETRLPGINTVDFGLYPAPDKPPIFEQPIPTATPTPTNVRPDHSR